MQSSPQKVLKQKSLIWNLPIDCLQYAERLDQEDPLSCFRDQFCIPKKHDLPYAERLNTNINNKSEECIYMCGQSLGLQPKGVNTYVADVLNTWATRGVHCHFSGSLPAAHSDMPPKAPMARLVGAKVSEVAIMNGLTVNLHLLLCTFYRPTQRRYKIMIEEHAFSSDMYAVKSQIAMHGLHPESSLVLLKPRPGESLIREEDAIRVIETEGETVAVFLIPGIQYYTGQLFNIPRLTQAAHSKGITVGADLAHAAGNVPLYLHDWGVDFAVWCTYKYLNSGAGGIAAIFVHEDWTSSVNTAVDVPALKGWWGNAMTSKFSMKAEFEASDGADMWKLSNPPPLLCATLMASLDVFSQTSMEEISGKQFLLTGYLEALLKMYFSKHSIHHYQQNDNHSSSNCNDSDIENSNVVNYSDDLPSIEILTPSDPKKRGSQLSISFSIPLCAVQEELKKNGIVCDVRKPCVLRVAPAPLYNSFCDVFKFVTKLVDVCRDLNGRIKHIAISDNEAFVDGESVRSEDEDTTSNSSQEMENMSTVSSIRSLLSQSSMSSSANHASNSSLNVTSSSCDSDTDSSSNIL